MAQQPTYQRELESDSLLETVVLEEHEQQDGVWASGQVHVAGAAVIVFALIMGVFAVSTNVFYTTPSQSTSTSPMRSSGIFGEIQIASRTAPLCAP